MLVISPPSGARTQATRGDWLDYGLTGRGKGTVDKYTILCRKHIIPALGARKLRDLTATDVDRWLAEKAKTLSTRTVRDLHACLNRSISRAMAREHVKRNVVPLCGVPTGQDGRPSRSLDLGQAIPRRCVAALRAHHECQERDRERAGKRWRDTGLVFATGLLAGNVRRSFRTIADRAGLVGADWTPRELRHSFVSLLSSNCVRLEDIADLCGHSATRVTEQVYGHQLRPMLLGGAVAMDRIFEAGPER